METSVVRNKIYELASRTAEDEGLELVGIDLGRAKKMMLRVVIDKEGGVTVGDCEKMSRGLEALLDVEDLIKGPYMLEVSSPGIDRPLKTQRDFEKSLGKLARVVTVDKIDDSTFFVGRIIDTGEGWIRLKLEETGAGGAFPKKKGAGRGKQEGKDIFIPLEKISKARLEIEMKRGD